MRIQQDPMERTMSKGIVVVGAGGHAKVVIELFRAMGDQVEYCVGGQDAVDECLGVPVRKGDEWLDKLRSEGYGRAFIAIGPNRLRIKLAEYALSLGYELVNAISPTAVISPTAMLGNGIAVMAGTIINAASEIGDLTIINTGATVDHDCIIGRAVHIAPQCGLAGTVRIGEGSFLGIGSRVIPEKEVGAWTMIGAGAVVTCDIPPHVTAVGVPARVIKKPD